VKKIIYAGETFMTGDAIADAVLRVSKALAQNADAETVEIPTLRADGTQVTATLLVGPSSQIVAQDAPDVPGEIVDAAVVDSLTRRAQGLESNAGASVDPPDSDWSHDI